MNEAESTLMDVACAHGYLPAVRGLCAVCSDVEKAFQERTTPAPVTIGEMSDRMLEVAADRAAEPRVAIIKDIENVPHRELAITCAIAKEKTGVDFSRTIHVDMPGGGLVTGRFWFENAAGLDAELRDLDLRHALVMMFDGRGREVTFCQEGRKG